jgi:hypothetical protein
MSDPMWLCGLFLALPLYGQRGADLAAYQAAAARAHGDAGAQVRLALWCEAHGLAAERVKHLALAVLAEPKNAQARGLLGQVEYNGQWQHPDDVSKRLAQDHERNARVQEYLRRRSKTPDTADGHWKLALWCEQNGLKEQASALFHEVLRLDPTRDAARRRLGFKKTGGRWIKPDELAAIRARALEQQKADRYWKPLLERWRAALLSKDPVRRRDAETALMRIDDRLAVPMVWATFSASGPALQQATVQVLGQIDDRSASRLLVLLAVFSGSAEVRGRAIATLRRRDPREFADMLVSMIQEPIEYEVRPVRGPGEPGALVIKGQGSAPDQKRLYSPPAAPSIAPQPGDSLAFDEYGLSVIDRKTASYVFWTTFQQLQEAERRYHQQLQPSAQAQNRFVDLLAHSGLGASGRKIGQLLIDAYANQPSPLWLMAAGAQQQVGDPTFATQFIFEFSQGLRFPVGQLAAQAQQNAAAAAGQLQSDIDAIKQFNASLRELNDRILPVLNDVSGLDLGPKPLAWQTWFSNLVGYQLNQLVASAKATVIENVPLSNQPQPLPVVSPVSAVSVTRISCFGAGTMVHTLSGLRPIEELKVGEPVLTQSTRSGALAYKRVLMTHHNPPSKTFRIRLGGETIVSSHYHRFWKAGSGWVMARDLKAGDAIRTLSGTVKVTEIGEGAIVPVFNLDVADEADFFVGHAGALAHDNTLPNLREQPFDAVGALTDKAATVRAGKP